MPKITEIIDPAFRNGAGAKGPWTLMKIGVEGKEATIFAPASVGDEVILTYNEQYKNYSATKATAGAKYKAEQGDKLDTILRSLGRIERHLGITGLESKQVEKVKDVFPAAEEVLDDEVDLSSIPF